MCIWFNSEDENNINKNLKSKLEDLKVTLIIKSLENAQIIFYRENFDDQIISFVEICTLSFSNSNSS